MSFIAVSDEEPAKAGDLAKKVEAQFHSGDNDDVISHPEVTCAISGADTDAQMDENLGAVALELAPEDLARLDQLSGGLRMSLDGPQYAPARS